MSTQQQPAIPSCSAQAIIDWVFTKGRLIFVYRLAHQMNDNGASIDRLMIALQTLNPQLAATSETWEKSTDRVAPDHAAHGVRDTERYIGSPLQVIFETRKPASAYTSRWTICRKMRTEPTPNWPRMATPTTWHYRCFSVKPPSQARQSLSAPAERAVSVMPTSKVFAASAITSHR
jgi:hypothetical protein